MIPKNCNTCEYKIVLLNKNKRNKYEINYCKFLCDESLNPTDLIQIYKGVKCPKDRRKIR